MKFTCIIPTHGRNTLLKSAVRSALEQTCPPSQVIVVDDLGDKEARASIAALSDSRVIYLDRSNEGGPGASASRNHGARAALTPWLAFLDDDDHWAPDYLQNVSKQLESSSSDVCVTWMAYETDRGCVPGPRFEHRGLTASQVVARNPGMTGSNLVVDRELFYSLGGFDEALRSCNDRDFLIRLLQAGAAVTTLKMELVFQRIGGAAHLSSRTPARATALTVFAQKHAALISRHSARRLRRERASILRVTASWWIKRRIWTVIQACTYTPAELLGALKARREGGTFYE